MDYYNAAKTKRAWYNRQAKVWTLQHLDAEGNQVGSADYCHNRCHAFEWLNA